MPLPPEWGTKGTNHHAQPLNYLACNQSSCLVTQSIPLKQKKACRGKANVHVKIVITKEHQIRFHPLLSYSWPPRSNASWLFVVAIHPSCNLFLRTQLECHLFCKTLLNSCLFLSCRQNKILLQRFVYACLVGVAFIMNLPSVGHALLEMLEMRSLDPRLALGGPQLQPEVGVVNNQETRPF